MEKREVQQKVMEYNIYKQQAEGLMQEMAALNQTAQSLQSAKAALENIKDLEGKPEVLVPVGGNTFLTAEIKDTRNVLIGIGAGVVVKKGTGEAIEALDKQIEAIKSEAEKIKESLELAGHKMQTLEPTIEKALGEMQKGER